MEKLTHLDDILNHQYRIFVQRQIDETKQRQVTTSSSSSTNFDWVPAMTHLDCLLLMILPKCKRGNLVLEKRPSNFLTGSKVYSTQTEYVFNVSS